MLQRNSIARLIVFVAIGVSVVLVGDPAKPSVWAQSPDQIHLYFFTNDGCAPCRQVEPSIEQLKREGYPVSTVKLNDQPQLGASFKVALTPTVILVANGRIVGRHTGLIEFSTLRSWFATVGYRPGVGRSGAASSGITLPSTADQSSQSSGAYVAVTGSGGPPVNSGVRGTGALDSYSTSTMHQGTRQPGNSQEQLAMQATVRIKVEDPKGTSYATGTVIHSSDTECLVLTCGHVFRESGGKGIISADYGLGAGPVRSGSGKLVFYDSDARDIALVVIQSSYRITPVPIASRQSSIQRGHGVFSLGCDRGELPTIRHSKIKNHAAYNGANKYDIYGRPVDGRSGGGLFTASGELIGVCNAAAVDVDEGIYTALDTIYWQLATVRLDHLFVDDTRLVSSQPVAPRAASAAGLPVFEVGDSPSGVGGNPPLTLVSNPSQPSGSGFREIRSGDRAGPGTTQAVWNGGARQPGDDREVIIIVRSRNHPSRAETITISDPTPELLDYLEQTASSMAEPRQMNVARLRMLNPTQARKIAR